MPHTQELTKTDILLPFVWTIGLLILDIVFYGWMVPILALYLTELFLANVITIGPLYELLLVICVVCGLLFVLLYAHVETIFWHQLFTTQFGFSSVLQVRDGVNILMAGYYLIWMYSSIGKMIEDQGMKKNNLSEGLEYVILSPFVRWGWISETLLNFGSCESTIVEFEPVSVEKHGSLGVHFVRLANTMGYGTLVDQRIVHRECGLEFIHGAEFIFAIAGFTATIGKLVYFNTLCAYVRAMTIVIDDMELKEKVGVVDQDEEDMIEDIDEVSNSEDHILSWRTKRY